MLRIAIDIGGTFTDVVAETRDGRVATKLLTTPRAPEEAAHAGVEAVLREVSQGFGDITGIVHGTTLATNALIERRGARTGFVTTAGFRDVLEMRYEKRFSQYDLDIEMPEALVPRPLRLGLDERVLADGHVLRAPEDRDIRKIAETLRAEGVEAVAVGFLHAYRNPENEIRVASRLAELLGDKVTVCRSAEVSGEIREYERFSTVCANAYVRPLMSRYLGRLLGGLERRGFDAPFLMMLSDGALTTVEQASRFPIRLVEGGPAGGVALAAHVARELGSDKTLSLDIGGTTAKICFLEGAKPKTTRLFEVARAWRDVKGSGLPVKVPTVELVEIGSGGGSIASVDRLGRLVVGPKSAGSDPGPAAYGLGGERATITDAHLCVGNIAPEGFAAGKIKVDPSRARQSVQTDVERPLGAGDVETAAAGIVELADETMANAARVHGIELGLDIAAFDLLVSGGGGGLHGARIAEKLGIRRIIVPENAGVGSAVGFLRAPVAFEMSLSVVEALADVDARALGERLELALGTVRGIVGADVPADRIVTAVSAELRYRGQGLDLALPITHGEAFAADLQGIGEAFEAKYENLVGFRLDGIAIELVSLSVTAREVEDDPEPAPVRVVETTGQPARRPIYDLAAGRRLDYAEIGRDALGQETLEGPAVVTETQTTTLVRPGWRVSRRMQGHLVLEREVEA